MDLARLDADANPLQVVALIAFSILYGTFYWLVLIPHDKTRVYDLMDLPVCVCEQQRQQHRC